MCERLLVLAVCFLAGLAPGQPLPKIALQPVFPKLACSNLVGMEEVPDGSRRFALVGQDGRILLVREGTDGSEAAELLNIEDRQPHVSLEQGLLGLAFHPGFKTNGLFYIYYSRQDPRRTILSEWKVSAGEAGRAETNTERILLEIPSLPKSTKPGK